MPNSRFIAKACSTEVLVSLHKRLSPGWTENHSLEVSSILIATVLVVCNNESLGSHALSCFRTFQKQTNTHTHTKWAATSVLCQHFLYQKPLSIAQKRSVHVTTLFGCDVDPGYRLLANHSLQARLRHFTNSSTASKLCACPSTPHKCYTWTLGWAHSQNHCPQKPFQCHCQIARL